MASPPPLPKPAIPLNGPVERIPPSKVPVPKWRWVVAVLLAPLIVAVVQGIMLLLLGQALEVPERYEFVVTIALWALPLGIALWVLRGFLRPKPPKPSNERSFPVVQNQVNR